MKPRKGQWPWSQSNGIRRAETPPEIVDRLSIPEPNSGCWIWLGETNKQDYPTIYYKIGKRKPVVRRAQRVICELVNAEEIPDKLTVDHTCHQTWCVNPDHLEVVTQGKNNERRRPYLRKKPKCGHEFVQINKGRRGCPICLAEYMVEYNRADRAANKERLNAYDRERRRKPKEVT